MMREKKVFTFGGGKRELKGPQRESPSGREIGERQRRGREHDRRRGGAYKGFHENRVTDSENSVIQRDSLTCIEDIISSYR
jgi:hypothetical protein